MRKVLSVLLAVLMLATTMAFAAVPASALDPSGIEGNINWTYNPSTKTLTLSGDGSMNSYYAATPAWEQYNTAVESIVIKLGVTSIGEYAFMGFSVLKTVTIADSVTLIDRNAFSSCSSLETLYISDSVTRINEAAFYHCTALNDIYYPGTQAQWNNIFINYNYDYNLPIDNAELHTDYGYIVSASASPAAGGTVSADARYLPNTDATVIATSNAGYAFEGWYSGSTRVANTPKYTFTVTWNTDLTAKFVTSGATTYSVTVFATGGGSVSGAGTYNYGSFATVKATPRNGYTFDGWYDGSTKVSSSAEYRFSVSRDISLEAKFTYTGTPGTYTVTVSAGTGGTASGGGHFVYNEFATVIAKANNGYAFDGWYEGSNKIASTLTWHFQVSRDISLEAKFTYTGTPSTYTVTVSAETGGTVSGGGTFTYGEFATVTAEAKDGYVFKGWYDGDKKVSDQESYRFSVGNDYTLTAHFEKDADSGDNGQNQNQSVCPWCGGQHVGFFQGIIGFFHRIFARIFGAKY